MPPSILDSNILMYLLRGNNETVARKAVQHRNQYGHLYIAVLTYYEIKRGWEYNATSHTPAIRIDARRKLRQFDDFCFENQVLTLTKDACGFAAEIYSQRRRANLESYKVGLDILIAGIALAKGYAIATENTQDFSDIDGLVVYNWLQP